MGYLIYTGMLMGTFLCFLQVNHTLCKRFLKNIFKKYVNWYIMPLNQKTYPTEKHVFIQTDEEKHYDKKEDQNLVL